MVTLVFWLAQVDSPPVARDANDRTHNAKMMHRIEVFELRILRLLFEKVATGRHSWGRVRRFEGKGWSEGVGIRES